MVMMMNMRAAPPPPTGAVAPLCVFHAATRFCPLTSGIMTPSDTIRACSIPRQDTRQWCRATAARLYRNWRHRGDRVLRILGRIEQRSVTYNGRGRSTSCCATESQRREPSESSPLPLGNRHCTDAGGGMTRLANNLARLPNGNVTSRARSWNH